MKTLIKPKHVALITKYVLSSKNVFIGCYVLYQHNGMSNVQLILFKGDMSLRLHMSHTL